MEIYLIGLLISFIFSVLFLIVEIIKKKQLSLAAVLRTVLLTLLSWFGVFIEIIWMIVDIAIKAENIILWSNDKKGNN